MCGIAGIFNLNQRKVSQAVLESMTRAIAHRGPDGEGFFVDGNLGFGHRRLAILDTSDKGAQPMISHDKRWVVIFNGCIYNYPQLKRQLEKKGHIFKSGTDTEIITEGLSEYGPAIFQKFNGMFAIAAWDRKLRKLYLTRDRFGVKPLYYFFDGNTIVFASEIKAILKHPKYKLDLDTSVLNEYFTFQNVFRFQTLFKNITLLPPANTVELSSALPAIRHNSWWDYDFSRTNANMTFTEAKQQTQRLLAQAVKRQMLADVPVGSYLSGGMDSGSITALASQHVDRLTTFTAGFEVADINGIEATFDERLFAEMVANTYKTEHYEQVINAGDLSWSLPRVVWHLEDLRLGMSYPNYYISRLASKFVKVCLQGTGGDELFGGYPWRYYRVFKSLNQQQYIDSYYKYWQRLVGDETKSSLFTKQVFSQIDIDEPKQIFERVFTFNNNLRFDTPEDQINNSLYFEIKTFLHGILLVGDKLSMANALEERFPFLDNDLVNFAQTIPIKHKLGKLEKMKKLDENQLAKKFNFEDGKNVLRRAMRDILPDKIVSRRKQGFSSPEEAWYRGQNLSYVKEMLLQKKTVSTEFIQPAFIKKIINQHTAGKANHRLLIWSLINFEWWCRIFLNGERIE